MATSIPEPVVDGLVRLTVHSDGVAHVALNRPGSANGLSVELLKALHEVLMRVHGDSTVRAVLLTGEGKNFCAGGDVHEFLAKGDKLPDYIRLATSYLQIAAGQLIRLDAPVVSAVQGFAAGGGGMGLVCSSDFVVCGESTQFLAGATRVAMVPDAGVTVTLTQLVGFRRAMKILMLNKPIPASEALAMGLVTEVVPDAQLLERAWSLAHELAAGAPEAQAQTKRLLWNGIGQGVEGCMHDESATQARLSGMGDAMEGLAAVIERRKPVFTGR